MANLIPVVISLIVIIYDKAEILLLWKLSTPTKPDEIPFMSVASRLLILLSTCLLIMDNNLIPDRYRIKMPRICALATEYMITQIAMISMLYVWTRFQSMLCFLLKELLMQDNNPNYKLYDDLGGDIFLGYFTTAMSILTTWYTFNATGSKQRFKNGFFTFIDFIVDIFLRICDCGDDDESDASAQKK